MNPDGIWWDQIGTQLRFVSRVNELLEEDRSFVLSLRGQLPWRQSFYGRVGYGRSAFSADRRLKRLPFPAGTDPGAFVLENLCPMAVQADYYPGQTYAEYLGGKGDLIMCDYCVWVTGIHSRADFSAWLSFVRAYEAAAAALERRAVFVLEYDGPAYDPQPLQQVKYEVKSYDCRVFCLQLTSEWDSSDFLPYRAELALNIGGASPELSAALIAAGDRLPEEPLETVRRVLERERDSEGRPFPGMSEAKIISGIWRSCFLLFYPIIERVRMNFIAKHESELREYLPISNSRGETVSDPSDLEIGTLCHILTCKSRHVFPPEETENVILCHAVRNQLAHNKYLTYDEVSRVLAFGTI